MRGALSILMGCYILLLTLIPCVDEISPSFFSGQVHYSVTSKLAHEGDHDCCSPFCSCNCCNVPVEVGFHIIYLKVNLPLSILIAGHIFNYTFPVPTSIWEPPKA